MGSGRKAYDTPESPVYRVIPLATSLDGSALVIEISGNSMVAWAAYDENAYSVTELSWIKPVK